MDIYSNQKSGIAISRTNGLSPDTPFVLQNTFSNGYTLPRTNVNTSVEDDIINKVKARNLKRYQFPASDFPKYNFTLIENNVNVGLGERGPIGKLTPEKIYKFPLPDPMTDLFSVQYKTDFSYLNAITGNPLVRGVGAAAFTALAATPQGRAIIAILGATLGATVGASIISGGVKVNTFKTVTLDSPEFRNFELNWKFVPRNYTEAKLIQAIVTSLKRGSAPRFVEFVTGKPIPGLFRYPKVYTMFFQPNVQFLYKFKPAVLRAISIHYDGGSGAPSFYRPENGVESQSPVESVIINTNWLEIEYWASDNYKDDPNIKGMPSPNPLDAINDFKYIPYEYLPEPGGGAGPIMPIPRLDGENLNPNNPGGEYGTSA